MCTRTHTTLFILVKLSYSNKNGNSKKRTVFSYNPNSFDYGTLYGKYTLHLANIINVLLYENCCRFYLFHFLYIFFMFVVQAAGKFFIAIFGILACWLPQGCLVNRAVQNECAKYSNVALDCRIILRPIERNKWSSLWVVFDDSCWQQLIDLKPNESLKECGIHSKFTYKCISWFSHLFFCQTILTLTFFR